MSEEYLEHQHQRIMRQLKSMEEMQNKLAQYRAALLLISEWKMPYSGFGIENGSNGERDYFRKISNEALK
jgi:hypothetical protein